MSLTPDPEPGAPEAGGADVVRAAGDPGPASIPGLAREDLARATHDVNNALNSVLVASHMLQLSAADPDAVRRHAERIAQAARQGVAAASRLAAIARSV